MKLLHKIPSKTNYGRAQLLTSQPEFISLAGEADHRGLNQHSPDAQRYRALIQTPLRMMVLASWLQALSQ